jgi:hypothetical protein
MRLLLASIFSSISTASPQLLESSASSPSTPSPTSRSASPLASLSPSSADLPSLLFSVPLSSSGQPADLLESGGGGATDSFGPQRLQ